MGEILRSIGAPNINRLEKNLEILKQATRLMGL